MSIETVLATASAAASENPDLNYNAASLHRQSIGRKDATKWNGKKLRENGRYCVKAHSVIGVNLWTNYYQAFRQNIKSSPGSPG